MKALILTSFSICIVCLHSSCTAERTITGHTTSADDAFNERFFGGFTMVKDPDGTVSTTATRRSSFEKGEQIGRGTSLDKESYLTKKYDKTSYDGRDKAYETSKWTGKRSYDGKIEASDFMTKKSNIRTEFWNGQNKSYAVAKTDDQKKLFQEQNKTLKTETNSYINDARQEYIEPEYMNSRTYMKKTLEETKAMLGRRKMTEKDI